MTTTFEHQVPVLDQAFRLEGYIVKAHAENPDNCYLEEFEKFKVVLEPKSLGIIEELKQVFHTQGKASSHTLAKWLKGKYHIQADSLLKPMIFGSERFKGYDCPAGTYAVLSVRPEIKGVGSDGHTIQVLHLISVELFPEEDLEDYDWTNSIDI